MCRYVTPTPKADLGFKIMFNLWQSEPESVRETDTQTQALADDAFLPGRCRKERLGVWPRLTDELIVTNNDRDPDNAIRPTHYWISNACQGLPCEPGGKSL